MNRALGVVFGGLLLLGTPTQGETVRVGSFDYNPGIFRGPDGQVRGLFVDLLQAAAQAEGWQLEFVHGSWDEGLQRLRAGELDVLTSVAYTPERASYMDYGKEPLLSVWSEVYVPMGSGVGNITELAGKRVGVMRSDFNAADFKAHVQALSVDCDLVELPDFTSILEAMRDGQLDAGVINSTVGAARSREFGAKGTSIILNPFDIHFTVGKGRHAALLATLDRYLRDWRQDPTSIYYAGLRRWLRRDLEVRYELPHWLGKAAVLVLMMLLGGVATVVVQRRLVRTRTRELASSQASLRESEQRYRTLFSQSTDAFFLVDGATGRYLDANAAAEHLTGRPVAELTTLTTRDVTPDGAEVRLAAVSSSHDPQELGEVVYVRPDGSSRTALLSVVPLPDGLMFGIARDITDRKRAEEALAASEARLSAATENAPGMVYQYLLRPDGSSCFPYASPWVEAIFDVSAEELSQDGQPIFDRVLAEDAAALQASILRSAETLEVWRHEGRLRSAAGEVVWLRGIARPERLPDGSTLWTGILLDTTASRLAEEAVRESEARLRAVIDAAPFGAHLYELDDQERLIFSGYNGSAERILGTPHTPFMGLELTAAFPPLADTEVPARYAEVALTGVPFETEQVDYDHGGIHGAYEVRAVQTGPRKMAAFFRDVTERRRAEEALRQSEARFRELANMLPQIVFETDLTGRLTFVNEIALAMFGYTAEDLEAGLYAVDMIAAQQREQARERLGQVIAAGGQSFSAEYLAVRKDGQQFPVMIYSRCLIRGDQPVGMTGLMIDITERKQAEAERERLQAQLTQALKMDSIGRLAGGVAHDFNNMLNVILGHADLLLHDLADDNALRDDLEEIRRAAERSARLTQQLLAFARKQTVIPRALDINDTVGSMLRMLSRLIGEDIELAWQPGVNLPTIQMDPGQVDQILANLAVNARDAIRGPGGKLTIQTRRHTVDGTTPPAADGLAPGEYVVLTVTDNGCGMDHETLGSIFEPFFTTKGVGQGTGLGLATVYGIVSQNGGRIEVQSEPGVGTTFSVYLPAEPAARAPATDAPAAVARPADPTATILIVEDEPAVLRLARAILEHRGFRVLPAATPREAIALAETYEAGIDLLLTDVVMPEMNGRELAAALRTRRPTMHRLYMSGYTALALDGQDGLRDDEPFIQKPFTPDDLVAKVVATLARP